MCVYICMYGRSAEAVVRGMDTVNITNTIITAVVITIITITLTIDITIAIISIHSNSEHHRAV